MDISIALSKHEIREFPLWHLFFISLSLNFPFHYQSRVQKYVFFNFWKFLLRRSFCFSLSYATLRILICANVNFHEKKFVLGYVNISFWDWALFNEFREHLIVHIRFLAGKTYIKVNNINEN